MTPTILDTYLTLWLIKVLLWGSIGAIVLYFTVTLHRLNKWLLSEAQERAREDRS